MSYISESWSNSCSKLKEYTGKDDYRNTSPGIINYSAGGTPFVSYISFSESVNSQYSPLAARLFPFRALSDCAPWTRGHTRPL